MRLRRKPDPSHAEGSSFYSINVYNALLKRNCARRKTVEIAFMTTGFLVQYCVNASNTRASRAKFAKIHFLFPTSIRTVSPFRPTLSVQLLFYYYCYSRETTSRACLLYEKIDRSIETI